MKKIFILLIILTFYGCNKPKTVLICGDHVCINKAEAEQYFEENLTLEVRILDKKKSKETSLVEINLESNTDDKKEISILSKKETNKKIKILSSAEIKEKKVEINEKRKAKIVKKRNIKKVRDKKVVKQVKLEKLITKEKDQKKLSKTKKKINKPADEIKDVCTIIKKCSIEEISKYLVKQGRKKKFPDITIRENK